MEFAVLRSGLVKSANYCPNPIIKNGIPKYADALLNPKVRDTPAYNQWWEEQVYYCKNGYTTGGLWVPGRYYKFVNFDTFRGIAGDNIRAELHDFQLDFAYLVEQAKKEHFNIIIPKARRKSVTTMNICMVVDYGYRFEPGYKAAVVAGKQEFADVFMDEWKYIDSKAINEFRVKKLPGYGKEDTVAGWKQKNEQGEKIEYGTRNTIYTRTVFHDPAVLKGKFCMDIVLEESGENEHLIEVINDSHACIMDGDTQVGVFYIYGCVCAGTKVWDNAGNLINIEDLKQEQGILGFDGNGISKEGISWMKPPAQKNCYRITTSGNNVIECSEDHPLMWTKRRYTKWVDGKHVAKSTFKRAHEVRVGDQLLLIDKVDLFGTKKMWAPRLIGLMIGDGNITSTKSPSIGACEDGIQKYLENNFNVSIAKQGNKKRFITKKGEQYKSYTIKGITNKLREVGIYGLVKKNKRLPENIGEYDKESLAELLGGYFDADGNVTYSKKLGVKIVLTSVVKELLEQVKFQLTKFGINSCIYKENRNNDLGYGTSTHIYRLYITKYSSVLRFKENIYFLCKHKQDVLDSENFVERAQRFSRSKYKFELNPENNKGGSYGEFVTGLRHETVNKIEFIGLKDVYNLTADKTHTYIANNFVTGNTGGNMNKGSKGFKKIWYDVKKENKFNCKGLFIPGTVFYKPYYSGATDLNGNVIEDIPNLQNLKPHERVGWSDEVRAGEAIKARKELLLNSGDLKEYFDYCQNYPTTEEEVFRKSASNNFPILELNAQGHKLLSEESNYEKFKLYYKKDAQGNTEIPYTVYAERASKDTPEEDCVLIHKKGHPMPNYRWLDVGGIDSYDQDQSKTSSSLGAMVVFRRKHSISDMPDWLPVALIRNRPKRKEIFYEQCMMLSIYYNLIDGVLGDRANGVIINHFKEMGCERYLSHSPKKYESPNSQQQDKQLWISINNYSKPKMMGVLQTFFFLHTPKVEFIHIIDEALNYDEHEIGSDNDTIDALGIALMKALDMDTLPTDETELMKNDPFAYPDWGINGQGQMIDKTAKNTAQKDPNEDIFSFHARMTLNTSDDDEPQNKKQGVYDL